MKSWIKNQVRDIPPEKLAPEKATLLSKRVKIQTQKPQWTKKLHCGIIHTKTLFSCLECSILRANFKSETNLPPNSKHYHTQIVKILNVYIIRLLTHLYHSSFQYNYLPRCSYRLLYPVLSELFCVSNICWLDALITFENWTCLILQL